MAERFKTLRGFWTGAIWRLTARRAVTFPRMRVIAILASASLALVIAPTAEATATTSAALPAMKGAAIAVCNMIRDAKSTDQVRSIVNNADGLSAKLERTLATLNSELVVTRSDTQTVWSLSAYYLSLDNESRLQTKADEVANMLTALTFAGPAISGCADAKIAKLEQKPIPTEQEPPVSPVIPAPPEHEAAAPPAPNVPTGPVCDQVAYDTARKAYLAAKNAKYPKGYAAGAEAVWAEKNDPMSDNVSAVNVFINGAKTGDYGELCDLYRRGAAIYNAHIVTPESVP